MAGITFLTSTTYKLPDTSTTNSVAFSANLVSGTNRVIVIDIVTCAWLDREATSVTYGGVALTQARKDEYTRASGFHPSCQQYYLLEASMPSNGNNTVAIGYPGSIYESLATFRVYNNLMQQAPEANNGRYATSTTTLKVAVTTLTPNAMVLDNLFWSDADDWDVTVGAVQIQRSNQADNTDKRRQGTSEKIKTTPASATMTWTPDSTGGQYVHQVSSWQEWGWSAEFVKVTNSSKTTSASTSTYSVDIDQANNKMLVVGILAEFGTIGRSATSVTYNQVAMHKARADYIFTSYGLATSIWYLLNGELPATGTNSVTIKMNGAVDNIHSTAIQLKNIEQTAPYDVSGNTVSSGNNITSTISTEFVNGMAIDVVGCGNTGSYIALTGQTERSDLGAGSSTEAMSTKYRTSAGTTSLGWTHSGANRQAQSVISVNAAGYYSDDGICDITIDGTASEIFGITTTGIINLTSTISVTTEETRAYIDTIIINVTIDGTGAESYQKDYIDQGVIGIEIDGISTTSETKEYIDLGLIEITISSETVDEFTHSYSYDGEITITIDGTSTEIIGINTIGIIGIEIGGEADQEATEYYVYSGVIGIEIDGTAEQTYTYNYSDTGLGGIEISGTADEESSQLAYQGLINLETVITGISEQSRYYEDQGLLTIDISGTVTISQSKNYIDSGIIDITLSGTAMQEITHNLTDSGLIELSIDGEAIEEIGYSTIGSIEITIDGSAIESSTKEYIESGLGGLEISVIGIQCYADCYVYSGIVGITISGTASEEISYFYSYDGLAGIDISGEATEQIQYSYTGTGEIILDGSCIESSTEEYIYNGLVGLEISSETIEAVNYSFSGIAGLELGIESLEVFGIENTQTTWVEIDGSSDNTSYTKDYVDTSTGEIILSSESIESYYKEYVNIVYSNIEISSVLDESSTEYYTDYTGTGGITLSSDILESIGLDDAGIIGLTLSGTATQEYARYYIGDNQVDIEIDGTATQEYTNGYSYNGLDILQITGTAIEQVGGSYIPTGGLVLSSSIRQYKHYNIAEIVELSSTITKTMTLQSNILTEIELQSYLN